MTPDEYRKLSKEDKKKFREDVINPPDDLPVEYTDESTVDPKVLNWTTEQVAAYNKHYERISKY